MKDSLRICFGILLVLGGAMTLSAQDTGNDSGVADDSVETTQAVEAWSGALATRTRLEVPYLSRLPVLNVLFPSYGVASEDGHYLAQDQAELQTYYDLALSYQYIEEDYLRRQLELPSDQGIIVTTATESGLGFKNGFRDGDIVLQIDEESVDTQYEVVIELGKLRGSPRTASILRDGLEMELVVLLTEQEETDSPKRWIIGVWVDEISNVTKAQLEIEGGAAVTKLSDDGPARRMGVVEHDIITHIDGQLINCLDDLKTIVSGSAGATLQLDLVRLGKKVTVNIDPQEASVEATDLLLTDLTTLQWNAALALDTGSLTLVPQVVPYVDPASGVALSWQVALAEQLKPAGDLSDRLSDIEATLKQLENQIRQLKSSHDE